MTAPTSDERREVAAKLRAFVPEINGTNDFAMYLNHWIGVGNANVGDSVFSVKSDRRTAEMTLEKLADLIDPTCHLGPAHFGGFGCDRCFTWFPDMKKRTSYCPECGARVVDDGDR